MSIKTGKVLRPGQPGTKKWVEKFGEDLVCVRYRYDESGQRKFKTVELVVSESIWKSKSERIPRNKIMTIKIHQNEAYLRRLVKSAGGRWNWEKKLWKLPYGEILDLGLEKRIEKEN